PTMCSLSRCLHELTSRQPVEEFHQLVSLSTLHTLLTSQPDGSDLTAGQRPISGKQPAVLIDLGDSLRWICGPRTGWLCGCDWRGLRLNLAARLRDFQASLFLPMPLLPGDGGASHCDKLDWAAEQRGRKHRVATIIRYLRELQPAAGAQAQQTWPRPAFSLWLPPPGLVTALRFCLRRLEVPCQQSLDSRLAECARISTNIGCRAIASDSPLCWLLQPPNRSLLLLNSLSPAGGRAFHGYQQLQMRQALLPRLCGLLGLSADRLPMLACLLTDRFLPADCLQKLHLELAPECSSEPRQARLRSVALAVAKIVAGFSSPDAVDEALKLLEPHAASEEERSGLRRQIEAGLAFYGPCCSPATAQDPKSPPAPVDACIEGHKFDPWLVSRAKELHLSGRLHPWVAQVLHYREVRIELGFEDPPQPEAAELDDRLELTVDLFADIRARAYLLLYDIRRAEEDINCSAAAVRETVCRQERGLTTSTVLMTTARFEKGLKQLELPLCAELWGRVGQAGDGVRTTAFLACMHGWRLADPLCAQPLLDPAAVPPGLFLPLSVLRCLLLPPPCKPLLQPFELHALLATLLLGCDADAPEAPGLDANAVAAAVIADASEPPPTLRGLQLASLFAAGLDTAVFVSDACGRVSPEVVNSVAAGFLAFDGRRFQRLLRLADHGRAPPLLLCEGSPERLDAFESALAALFRSLSPVGGPCFQKPRLCQPAKPGSAQRPQPEMQRLSGPEGRGGGRGRGLRPLEMSLPAPQPPPAVRCYPAGQLRVAGHPVSSWDASRLSCPPPPTSAAATAAVISAKKPTTQLIPSGAEGNMNSYGGAGFHSGPRKQRNKSAFRPLRLSDVGPPRKSQQQQQRQQNPPAGPQTAPLQDERLLRLQQLLPGPPGSPEDVEEKFIKAIGRGLVIG
ncbi:hypothetical protein BOX15_Mlig023702g2, partial [Macrostomum lignano]